MKLPGFVGPSYKLGSINAGCQRSLNLYPEQNEMNPLEWHLVSRPSMTKLNTVGAGPCRGMYRASNNTAYVVSGNELYDITVPTAPVLKGTLLTSSGAVGLSNDVNSLVLVDGTYGYTVDLTTGLFEQITDPDFPKASSIGFIDQYMLANDADSGRFQLSALNDARNWDGLDVASAEGSPDNLIAIAIDHREAILFGDQTTEVWFDTGDSLNPFQRRQGVFIEHGIAGKNLHSLMDNTRLWWSKDADGQAVAMRMNGYTAERVSTYAVELAVQSYGDISNGTCFAYQFGGHTFWQTSFPGANVSWVFDAATQLWHEQSYMNPETGLEERHRAECHIFHNNMHIVGDYANGNIYKFGGTEYSDDSAYIARERTWPAPDQEGKRVTYRALEINMETGIGPEVALLDGSGNNRAPQMMLSCSDDAGHTYGNEDTTSLGEIGDRNVRARWTRLGSSRNRVFKVRVTDPVAVTLIAAWVDAESAAH
jgi:hypothetical protein